MTSVTSVVARTRRQEALALQENIPKGLALQPVRQIFQTVHRVHRVLPTVRGVVENAVDELPRSRPPTLQNPNESKKELHILER